MDAGLNKSWSDLQDRYDHHVESGWGRIHRDVFRSRMTWGGDILPQSVRDELASADRPALNYNLPFMFWKTASGLERQGRVDDRAFPMGDGDKDTAAAITDWLKHHSKNCHLPAEYSRAYSDLWIGGLAVMENSRVVLEDPLGEQQSVCGNPLQHVFDLEGARVDGRDMQDQMKEWFLPAGDVAARFGISEDDAKAILEHQRNPRALADAPFQRDLFDVDREEHSPRSGRVDKAMARGRSDADLIRGLEWHFVRWEPRVSIYDVQTAGYKDVTDLPETEIAQLLMAANAQGRQMLVVRNRTRRVYRCVGADPEILVEPVHYGPNVFPNTFGIGYRVGNLIKGEIHDLTDPTIGFSKGVSATTEVVGKTGNVGIILDADDDIDPDQEANLEAIGRGHGGVARIPRGSGSVTMVRHDSYPAALFNYADQSLSLAKALASSTDSIRGVGTGSHQSGTHAAAMIEQGMVSSEALRDNFLLLRKLTAETNIRLFQWFESPIPFRTIRILRDDDTPDELQFNQRIGSIVLNDLSVGVYGVKVDQTAYTVTDRHQKAQAILAAFQAAGIAPPPQMVLELSDDPDAARHMEMVNDWQRQQLEQAIAARLAARLGGNGARAS